MRWNAILPIGALVLLAGCGGDPTSSGTGNVPDDGAATVGTVLSAPLPRALVPLPGPAGASLVFVAATPATVPGAARAVVRNGRGDSTVAFVRDGGFDPLGVAAAEGDAIEVRIVDSVGRSSVVETRAARKPPRVVRTSPEPRRTDVPLNVRVTVVFSSPMEPATAVAGVHVERNGVAVPGTVRVSPDGLRVEFEPAGPLVALEEYELTVDPDVQDVLGTPLGENTRVPFRTGSRPVDIVGMTLVFGNVVCNGVCGGNELSVGESIELRASAYARWLTGPSTLQVPTQWSVSDNRALRVTELSTGVVRIEALAPGSAEVRATVAPGISEAMRLDAYAALPTDLMSTRVWYAPDNGAGTGSLGVWWERLDGTGREQVFALSELPAESAARPEFTFDCNEPHGFALSRTGRLAITVGSISPVDHHGGVWIKDGPGGPLRRVTPAGELGSANFPAWSFDGQRLAYWFDLPDQGMTELRVVEADGSGQRVLERLPYRTDEYNTAPGFEVCGALYIRPYGGAPLVWHPDGQRLLKWDRSGTQRVALDGSGSSPYLAGYLAGPWMPDGERQLVYQGGWFPQYVGYFYAPRVTYEANRDGSVLGSYFVGEAPLDVSPDGRLMIQTPGFNHETGGRIATLDGNAVQRTTRRVRGFVP